MSLRRGALYVGGALAGLLVMSVVLSLLFAVAVLLWQIARFIALGIGLLVLVGAGYLAVRWVSRRLSSPSGRGRPL